jgi:hypothetical protein
MAVCASTKIQRRYSRKISVDLCHSVYMSVREILTEVIMKITVFCDVILVDW